MGELLTGGNSSSSEKKRGALSIAGIYLLSCLRSFQVMEMDHVRLSNWRPSQTDIYPISVVAQPSQFASMTPPLIEDLEKVGVPNTQGQKKAQAKRIL